MYQYFPNKVASLFLLQIDEWRQKSELLRSVLEDVQQPPLERLRTLTHLFICSEFEEAAARGALVDIKSPPAECHEARRQVQERMILCF